MTQWIKELTTNLDDKHSTTRTHMLEELTPRSCHLTSTCVPWSTLPITHMQPSPHSFTCVPWSTLPYYTHAVLPHSFIHSLKLWHITT